MQETIAYPFKRTVVHDAVFRIRAHLGSDYRFGAERQADAADNHVHPHHGAVHGAGERFVRAWHESNPSLWMMNEDAASITFGTFADGLRGAKFVPVNPTPIGEGHEIDEHRIP